MLQNIFLFKGKKYQDLENLNIYSYPSEIFSIKDKDLVNNIILGHDQGKKIENFNSQLNESHIQTNHSNHNRIDKPVVQQVNNLNMYTSCINGKIIVGLIFEQEDNPYDYRGIFEELLNELLNNGSDYSFNDEIEIDNLLISMFIDIRRYGDEIIEKSLEIEYYYQRESFYKIFLFGVDEVGKSSLVRRLRTGEFNDNYFTPTRKFNIEYIQSEERGLLAFWDMPGQQSFRKKWLIGLQDSNIIVYMIDIANQRRFEESKKEFWNILNRSELNGIPLLIIGNKTDLMKYSEDDCNTQLQKLEQEISEVFNFEKIRNREWQYLSTSVKTNFNVDTVIQTIFELISS